MFTHLLSKGYSVSVGRIGKLECDFIVRKGDEYAYVQASMAVVDSKVEEREYAPFSTRKHDVDDTARGDTLRTTEGIEWE